MKPSPLWRAGGAIALWSTSALATSRAVHLTPPLVVAATAFTIAAVAGAAQAAAGRRLTAVYTAEARVWLLGLFGMASYYLAYYVAFRWAPAVEVNLLNYLWPLLTVVLSGPLLGLRLRPAVLLAGLIGLAGAALIVTQGRSLQLDARHAAGYALGLWCGLSWAAFSCLLRRIGPPAAGHMPLFCAQTAVLGWGLAALTGGFAEPVHLRLWLPWAVYLGLGPLYLSFQLWDSALQDGNVAAIGLLSYLTPVLSTLVLWLTGRPLTPASIGGMVLILGAALLGLRASRHELVRHRPRLGVDA